MSTPTIAAQKLSIIPVILSGGSGTRLWPLSRTGFPKQFLALAGKDTLFQQAVTRLNQLGTNDIDVHETLVVTNEAHRFLVADQLRELSDTKATLLLEPTGRNTAPALTLAAFQALETTSDAILVVTPADQTIQHYPAFQQVLQQAVRVAAHDSIVILGVTPTHAETGYGYIQQQGQSGTLGEFAVAAFAEKPNVATAEKYLKSGDYSWNSGMFVLKASTWLKALEQFRPDIYAATQAAWQARSIDEQFIRPDTALFEQIPSESVDYAVMEKAPAAHFPIHILPLKDAGWNDLGAWDAVWAVGQKDTAGNVTHGDTLLTNTKNSLIYAQDRLVSVVGLENVVVVETPDAILVMNKNQSQDIKKIVEQLKDKAREEQTLHRKVHRPWGWYDSIDESDRFKVKRIQVKPGASLSLQKHHHRAEHWIVVKGTAEVTCGDKVILLTENQSTYIPLGETHRLVNPGTIPLEIIEIQSGSYLGEDDIVRFEDTYGRVK